MVLATSEDTKALTIGCSSVPLYIWGVVTQTAKLRSRLLPRIYTTGAPSPSPSRRRSWGDPLHACECVEQCLLETKQPRHVTLLWGPEC